MATDTKPNKPSPQKPGWVAKRPGQYEERVPGSENAGAPKGGTAKPRPTDTSYRVAPGNKRKK